MEVNIEHIQFRNEHETIQKQYLIHDKTLPEKVSSMATASEFCLLQKPQPVDQCLAHSRWEAGLEEHLLRWYWCILIFFPSNHICMPLWFRE